MAGGGRRAAVLAAILWVSRAPAQEPAAAEPAAAEPAVATDATPPAETPADSDSPTAAATTEPARADAGAEVAPPESPIETAPPAAKASAAVGEDTPAASCDPADPDCPPCQAKKKPKKKAPSAVPAPLTPCCDPKASKLCVSMKPKFVAIPVPTYNPQLEFSLGVMGMLAYRPIKKDKVSPPWSSAVFAMYTTNNSFAMFTRHEAFWDRDNNRAELTFGGGKFNSTFYGTGDQNTAGFGLPLSSAGVMFQPQYMRRVWNRLYLGARYRMFWNEAVLSPPPDDPDAPDFVPIETNLLHSGFGAVATFDSRDNRFSPTEGFYVPLNSMFFSTAFGGDDNFANMDLAINYYHSWFQKKLILATRGFFTIATADTPAHMKPGVGMGADLRGYAYGRYRNNLFMATQAELRWYFWWKFGAVTWAGIGSTAAGLDQLGNGTVLPSYGWGLRFLAFEEERLVIRVDYGRGDEESQFYFSVSEAF